MPDAPYYTMFCEHCGWMGSSERARTTGATEAGDTDVVCPRCEKVTLASEVPYSAIQIQRAVYAMQSCEPEFAQPTHTLARRRVEAAFGLIAADVSALLSAIRSVRHLAMHGLESDPEGWEKKIKNADEVLRRFQHDHLHGRDAPGCSACHR